MDNRLPDVSFERNMNQNYMILTRRDYFGNIVENNNDYRKKMLLENNIPGLLPVSHRLVNGEMRYYYKINSLQSLESIYNKKEINYTELKQILKGCIKLCDSLEEYLLDGSQIIFRPEYIYMNPDTLEMYFVCYPEYEEDIRESFVEFINVLLTKIDHSDNDAVLLSYKVYRYTKNQNYVISEIASILDNHTPNAKEQGQDDIKAVHIPVYQQDQPYDNVYDNIYIEPTEDTDKKKNNDKKERKDKAGIGIVLCLLVAITALALIIGDRMTNFIGLKGDAELYLYGIIAVSIAEMVVLTISRAKKKNSSSQLYKNMLE
jgi:hypothetical protein